MLKPEMHCRVMQKYFKVRRKEAYVPDAEQVPKEVQHKAAPELTHIYFMPVQTE